MTDTTPTHHIAVCAFPFGTHAAPLLLLARRISTVAPNIRFSFFSSERSNATLFKGIDVTKTSNIVPCNITLPELQPSDGPFNPLRAIGHFLEFSPDAFKRAIVAVEDETKIAISCVITDAFLWFCGEFAKEKDAMWIALWTAGAISLTAHVHTDLIRDTIGGGEESLASITGLENVRKSDLPMGIISGDLKAPFSQMLHKMGQMISNAKVVVVNVFQELSPQIVSDLNTKMRLLCVGPFPLTCPYQLQNDPYNCLEWLDNHAPKKVAYISFGTVAMPPPHELTALAEALEVSGIPFIWSLNDSGRPNLPESFLERIQKDEKLGKVVPWAPQMKLLAHPSVGVFVTHCGWNSIMESVSNGVPLICRPMLGDQVLNRRVIEVDYKFGIGVEGGGFTQSETINALNKVLSSEEGEHMRKKAEELKMLAQESIKQGGSSHENFNALMEIITSS